MLNESTKTVQSALGSEANHANEVTAICLVGSIRSDTKLRDILEKRYALSVYESENGIEFIKRPDVAFVLPDFVGPDYNYLFHAGRRIYGPTIIYESAQTDKALPLKHRPIFCNSMKGIVICFAGFHDKKSLAPYVDLIHHMGGSVRKGFTVSVTHIVANTTQSSKYRLAVGMGKKAMQENWILATWEKRMIPMTSALAADLICMTLPPFHGLKMYFHCISDSEKAHMSETAEACGATIAEPECCTHFVTESTFCHENLPDNYRDLSCRFVTAEWFWVSIQLDICANEDMYSVMPKQRKTVSGSRYLSAAPLTRTVNENEHGHSASNLNGSMDASSEMSSAFVEHMFSAEDIQNTSCTLQRGMTKRHQVAIEIEQTEYRYVEILRKIIELYKEPLEAVEDCYPQPLLDATEIKLIFGNLPPIYQVHSKLSRHLKKLMDPWNEDRGIGKVWLKHSTDLAKAYSPYINFYEKAKETLSECDSKRPRFHAFLKVRQNRADSNRESLQELLIRPVQRLPSVELLLRELLKHTDKSNQDYEDLQAAVESLKQVLNQINEGKRKTEGQVKLFEIVNSVEHCPPYLLASRRQLIGHMHVIALTNGSFTKVGATLTFYLFNDCLEIAKRKYRTNVRESESIEKHMKHIDLLFLSNVRRVVDVLCFNEFSDLFCMTIRNNMGDTSYPFRIDSIESSDQKSQFLIQLCNQVMITSCRTDMELQRLTNLDHCGDNELLAAIQKAMKNLRAGRRMSRAFSFSNTHKRLRRVVSQVATSVGGRLRRMSKSNLRMPLGHLNEELTGSSNLTTM